MDTVEAVKARRSVRAFKPDPVPMDVLKGLMEQALRGPSWANTQPWQFAFVTGEPLKQIKEGFVANADKTPTPDIARPYAFPEPFLSRLPSHHRQQTPEEKKAHLVKNYTLYGAPVVLYLLVQRNFFYQDKGINAWSLYDCGGVMQNFMLLAADAGIGTVVQAQAVTFPDVIRKATGIPDDQLIAIGVAVGYPDEAAVAAVPRSGREPVDSVVSWYGF